MGTAFPENIQVSHKHTVMEGKQIVTLTTDWGYRDFFAGKVKGKLYSYIPGVEVVDITHGIEPYRLYDAIFVVKHACLDFPPGTIHIIDISSSQTTQSPFVVVRYRDQYYICTDNGLPYIVFGGDATEAVVIDNIGQESNFYTFAASDLFCKVASMIAHGATLNDLGFPAEEFLRTTTYNNVPLPDGIKTYIAYIDAYGNANLNITYDDFERERRGRQFKMWVREVVLTEVVPSYVNARASGNSRAAALLTVSSTGFLQIAIREGSAADLMNLRAQESINIRFFDK